MDEKRSPETVPYIVYEAEMDRNERRSKDELDRSDKKNQRLLIALVISILIAVASNVLWLHAWMQYDYESSESTVFQTGEGQNTSVIGDGNGAD